MGAVLLGSRLLLPSSLSQSAKRAKIAFLSEFSTSKVGGSDFQVSPSSRVGPGLYGKPREHNPPNVSITFREETTVE